MSTPGYQIPIHNSLVSPLLMAGVPRRFAILNGTFLAAFVLGLHSLWAIPICLFLHILGVFLTKRDPYFFQIMVRHVRQKPVYRV